MIDINFIFLLITILIPITYSSKLHIGDETYEVLTPGFELGNLHSFPLKAPFILSSGCSAISKITNAQINIINSSASGIIVMTEYRDDDTSCFPLNHILECQKRDWCTGVFHEDWLRSPPGMQVWSYFDKVRSRSEYKVPLAQASRQDFDYFKGLILLHCQSFNQSTCFITLTKDHNFWIDMFTSIPFILYFRALIPLFSFVCLYVIIVVYKNHQNRKSTTTHPSSSSTSLPSRQTSKRNNIKEKCLIFQFISHIFKILLSIDPILSSQIYPYVVETVLIAGAISFQVASSILLSFVIRELTHAKDIINMQKKSKLAYVFICLFFIVDFGVSIQEGLNISFPTFQSLYLLAAFYIIGDVGLGIWYFWQGHQFLKKCSQIKKQTSKNDQSRLSLIQLSMFNSIGMIIFGLLPILLAIKPVYGKPWGYFCVYFFLLLVLQITSLFEILLFGGVVVRRESLGIFIKKKVSTGTAYLVDN